MSSSCETNSNFEKNSLDQQSGLTNSRGRMKRTSTNNQSAGHYFRGRRKCYLLFSSYILLAIVLLELVLLNPNLTRPVEAGKKKKIIKKIKEILPLVALLKRKKIILLPIPM